MQTTSDLYYQAGLVVSEVTSGFTEVHFLVGYITMVTYAARLQVMFKKIKMYKTPHINQLSVKWHDNL